MTTFDIVICSMLGLSVFVSLFKGFIKEIFSLLSYLGGFLVATKYQETFSQILMLNIPSKPISKVIAFVTIYILTAIIISLIGKIAKGLMYSGKQLSIIDRLMGGIVGFGKGIVIVVAVTFPLKFFQEINKELTKNSQTAPYIAQALEFAINNQGSLNIGKKITDSIDIDSAKKKFEEFKSLTNMADQLEDLKKKLPTMDKDTKREENPLDNHSKEDQQKLNDILNSFEK